jgi:hypothetical protein
VPFARRQLPVDDETALPSREELSWGRRPNTFNVRPLTQDLWRDVTSPLRLYPRPLAVAMIVSFVENEVRASEASWRMPKWSRRRFVVPAEAGSGPALHPFNLNADLTRLVISEANRPLPGKGRRSFWQDVHPLELGRKA